MGPVTSVDLQGCGLNDDCAIDIATALERKDSTLVSLSLKGNRIKDTGCIALAKAMAVNRNLRIINLFGQESGAKWGEATLAAWAAAYATNVTLLNIIWSTGLCTAINVARHSPSTCSILSAVCFL
eukprot:SAG31_NODE_513_length_14715_cov_22.844554_2_plen_126_part_00